MKLHELKIKSAYAYAKLAGNKMFEIRLNDRDYKVGDIVKYTCTESNIANDKLQNKLYYITFITNYEQKDGYVVFGEKEIKLCEK